MINLAPQFKHLKINNNSFWLTTGVLLEEIESFNNKNNYNLRLDIQNYKIQM